jgi:tRNA threonylcarbamoyladenosine biosynthesis protein TsaE
VVVGAFLSMLTPDQIKTLDLSQSHTIDLPDEAATAHLGARIAPQLRAGDVVYLHGDLGAGKSTLARGLIRALTTPDQDVPSPTFTLMQTYAAPDFAIVHLDLYRIERAAEIYELGLDENRDSSVLLIEWPGKLGPFDFDDRLDIALEQGHKTNLPAADGGRTAHLRPVGRFRD